MKTLPKVAIPPAPIIYIPRAPIIYIVAIVNGDISAVYSHIESFYTEMISLSANLDVLPEFRLVHREKVVEVGRFRRAPIIFFPRTPPPEDCRDNETEKDRLKVISMRF